MIVITQQFAVFAVLAVFFFIIIILIANIIESPNILRSSFPVLSFD
jgi:hypothetical protein